MNGRHFWLIRREPVSEETRKNPRFEKVEMFYGTFDETRDRLSVLQTDPLEEGYLLSAHPLVDRSDLRLLYAG